MVGKNNKTGQFRRQANENKRYTLKKLSVGLASVALGTVLFLGQANAVNAEEVDSDIEDNLPDDFTDEEAAERRAKEDILLSEDGDNAEALAEKTVFQFSYMEAGTGKKMDGFFGEYVNANEAEKAFRMYANEAGYSLENIQFDDHNSFTATIAPSSTDRYVEAAKGRARNLISGLDGLTDELKADYLEQVGAAVSVEEVEAVYNEAIEMATQQKEEANRYVAVAKDRARQLIKDLTNLTNDQKTHYLAKVEGATSVTEVEAIHAEAENVVNETPAPNRFVKIARDHARQLINKLGNLYDNQKADYIKRVDEADSVKAIEGILEEAQKHVNSAKGGENGQASTQPDKPSYDGDMTPTPKAPAESELDQAKMKATADIKALGYFTAKEKQDLLGRVKDYDNTGDIHFIVTKAQQENEKRHQLHRKLLELQFGTNPNNSLPEAGKHDKATPGDILNSPDKITLEVAKAKAIGTITHLEHFSREDLAAIKAEINQTKTTEEVSKIVMDAKEENANRGTVEKNKTGAKDYLSKEFGKDLDTMQRNAYARAIDKIKNNDSNYEKKVQDIVQVAIAEVLVSKAESGRHIEKAKEALAAASQETEGGKLIDGKQDLISKLQERLDQVVANTEFHTLEAKTKKTLDELLNLTQQVDQVVAKDGEVDQDQLDNIQTKVTELESTLMGIQKHIHTLPTAEAQEATNTVKDLRALLAKIRDQYSYEEVTPAEEAKESAKDYVDKGFGTDLMPERSDVYKKALDQISNDDPAYEQKVDDIIQVATAEVLVNKAEKGTHIKAAEEALAKALKTTEGGKLIADKDELIKQLQDRLAKVISKKAQIPPVGKKQIPSTEKPQTPEEAQNLKEKKEVLRNSIDTIQSLNSDQKKCYLDLLKVTKSEKQIEELSDLLDAETFLARTKSGELTKEQVIPAIKEKLSKVTDAVLLAKKTAILKELKSLNGNFTPPSTDEEKNVLPADDSDDKTENATPKVTFESKLEEAKKLVPLLQTLPNENKDNDGKPTATAEYKKTYYEFVEQVLELEKLVKTDQHRSSVEGLKGLFGPLKIFK